MFPVPLKDVANSIQDDVLTFKDEFERDIKPHLKPDKHYVERNGETLFTKDGLLRLGLFIKNHLFHNFIDSIESQEDKVKDKNKSLDNIKKIYHSLEKILIDLADELERDNNRKDLQKVEQFTNIFNKFLQIRGVIERERSHQTHNNSNAIHKATDLASKVSDDAYRFASKTEDDAYKFAKEMGKDSYNFTSDTRDVAHNFALKTEDDAFKFASKMEDDAYNFVSNMAENAYQFASKGMDYGYQFTTQGEDLGPMANRILWMATEIGIMADRIGEMSDRIVHTEHLIVDTAMLIQNFGLLIDGTVKHMSESILYAISMLLDKEFKPLQTADKHLELISEITNKILDNNQEYDLKVLENQKELRKITISALDKISKEF